MRVRSFVYISVYVYGQEKDLGRPKMYDPLV